MKKTIIAGTGLSGMIGSRIQELLKNDFEFINISQKEVDITNKKQVDEKISQIDFDLFIHLAALTNVDLCETEKELAWKINVEGTKNIFNALENRNKRMIYVSTDFVFDGIDFPFFEDSKPNPISYYGLTKYEGEKIIKDKAMIVRPSFPYRAIFSQKKDIVRNIISLLKENKTISGVVDSTITLTFIDDFVLALKHLFTNYNNDIYHIVGNDSLTPYDMIMEICDVFNLNKNLVSKTTYDDFYKGKAQRPKHSIIKTKNNNFYKMKTFSEGLKEIKKQLSGF